MGKFLNLCGLCNLLFEPVCFAVWVTISPASAVLARVPSRAVSVRTGW
jgi:hypothetical protein